MSKGYVYVLSNPAMPGLVKIGHSKHGGRSRAGQLQQTGVPKPFVLEFELYVEDAACLEAAAHAALAGDRVAHNREFFKIDPQEAAIAVIEAYLDERDYKAVYADFNDAVDAMTNLAHKLDVHPVQMCSAAIYISEFAAEQALKRQAEVFAKRAEARRAAGGKG